MYAALDLGSNSFHLLIAELNNGRLTVVERSSKTVQLGQGVAIDGLITPQAQKRGLRCLAEFRRIMARYPIEKTRACGTNALRSAKNAAQFLHAAAETGIDIQVISGLEEAELIYRGVVQALAEPQQRNLVIDIGGGSTEIIVGQGERILLAKSFALGCVSWRDRYFADKTITLEAWRAAIAAAHEVVAGDVSHYRGIGWDAVYASSGSAKAIARVAQTMHVCDCGFDRHSLASLQVAALDYRQFSELRLPGLLAKRRELFVPGLAIMQALFSALDIEQATHSGSSLREGMLDLMTQA